MLYDETFVRNLSITFESVGVDLVLSGHDHIYSRTTVFDKTSVSTDEGVTYVIGGSGSGSKFYQETGNRPWKQVVYDNNKPVYSIIDITDKEINFKAYAVVNEESVLIDEFKLDKE